MCGSNFYETDVSAPKVLPACLQYSAMYVVPETNLLSIKQMCKAIGALNLGLAIIIVVHTEF